MYNIFMTIMKKTY